MAGWPLVGREAELERVTGMISEPRARGAVIAGPAGAGKTRLGDECVARAGLPHVAVRATRAATAIPLGAFAPFLPPDGLGAPTDYSNLRRAADALLEQFPAGERGVCYVDDAHALDDASVALLLHVARAGSVFVLVTMRTDEPAPEGLRDLWKDELARVDLAPLDGDAVAALAQAILGAAVDGGTARALYHACQGNALYLRELLLGLVDHGVLVNEAGLWRQRGDITAPPRLAELVAERLEGLSGRELFVLQAIALVEPLGVKVTDELGWGNEWASLEERGLLVMHESGRRRALRPAHPMYGEVARAQMSFRRKQAILRGAAAAFAPLGFKRRDDARRMAVWQLEAGDAADPRVLLAAARDARVLGDHPNAARFARAAFDAGGGVEAAHLLGRSLDDIGENVEAEFVLAAAQEQAAGDTECTTLALARSDNLFRGLGRSDDAKRVLDDALDSVGAPLHQQELVAQRAMFSLFEGRVDDTLALTDDLLARPDDAAFCRGALQAAMVRFLSGRLEEAHDIATRAFEARVALGDDVDLPSPGVYLVALALAQEQLGPVAYAVATASAGYESAASFGARNGMAWLGIPLARAHLLAGRVQTAMRFAREVAVLFGELGHPGTRWGYGLVALAAAHAGDPGTAEEAIADLDAEPPTPLRLMDVELDRARAWAHAARGDLPRARAVLLDAAQRARVANQFTLEAGALHDVTRLGGADESTPRLAELGHVVDGPVMAARVAYAAAVAGHDGTAIEQAGEAFEALGAMLDAAEAFNEAAIAYRRAEDARRAASAAQRAKVAGEQCEGARTPSLAHGTDAAVLTKREREIATLASHGLANKEIAEALVVSSRTIENHLQRAYEKLGVSSRADLADALTRAGY